jgi:hypothetical protein
MFWCLLVLIGFPVACLAFAAASTIGDMRTDSAYRLDLFIQEYGPIRGRIYLFVEIFSSGTGY